MERYKITVENINKKRVSYSLDVQSNEQEMAIILDRLRFILACLFEKRFIDDGGKNESKSR
jgi:hypothetical protein